MGGPSGRTFDRVAAVRRGGDVGCVLVWNLLRAGKPFAVLDERRAQQVVAQETERSEADRIMDRLIQDQEFRALLERKLKELGKV